MELFLPYGKESTAGQMKYCKLLTACRLEILKIRNDTAYMYNFDFITNNFWFKSFDCKTERIISNQLITDGTVIERPYSISVHPFNGNIYICDAKSYTTNGDLLCFDKKGKLRYKIQQIGLNPNNVVIAP
jgi:hypothetical protein